MLPFGAEWKKNSWGHVSWTVGITGVNASWSMNVALARSTPPSETAHATRMVEHTPSLSVPMVVSLSFFFFARFDNNRERLLDGVWLEAGKRGRGKTEKDRAVEKGQACRLSQRSFRESTYATCAIAFFVLLPRLVPFSFSPGRRSTRIEVQESKENKQNKEEKGKKRKKGKKERRARRRAKKMFSRGTRGRGRGRLVPAAVPRRTAAPPARSAPIESASRTPTYDDAWWQNNVVRYLGSTLTPAVSAAAVPVSQQAILLPLASPAAPVLGPTQTYIAPVTQTYAAPVMATTRAVMRRRPTRAPNAPCRAFSECLASAIRAIALDDGDTLASLIASGAIDPIAPIMLLPVYGQADIETIVRRYALTQAVPPAHLVQPFIVGLYGLTSSVFGQSADRITQVPVPGGSANGVSVQWYSWLDLAATMVAPRCMRILLDAGAQPMPGESVQHVINRASGPRLWDLLVSYGLVRDARSARGFRATERHERPIRVSDVVRALVEAFPLGSPSAPLPIDVTVNPLDHVYRSAYQGAAHLPIADYSIENLDDAVATARVLIDAGYPSEGLSRLAAGMGPDPSAMPRQVPETAQRLQTVLAAFGAMAHQESAHLERNRVANLLPAEALIRDRAQVYTRVGGAVAQILAGVQGTGAVTEIIDLVHEGAVDPHVPLPRVFLNLANPALKDWQSLPWGLTSPIPPTVAGFAAYEHIAPLLQAISQSTPSGQKDAWPSNESVLNAALAALRNRDAVRLSVMDMDDAVDTLLDARGRSGPLSVWDVNPLTVARNALSAFYGRALRSPSAEGGVQSLETVITETRSLVGRLLDAGYEPDERMAAIPHPIVNSGMYELLTGAPPRPTFFPSGVGSDQYAAMALQTERDGLVHDFQRLAAADPRSPLLPYAGAIAETIARLYGLDPQRLAQEARALPPLADPY